MKPATDSYIPGVCNINKKEIAYRRKAGYVGVGVALVLFGILLGLKLSKWTRLILFLPLYIGAIGFLQAKNKFCVAYGAEGKQNANEDSTEATAVSDHAARARDKIKARSLNLQVAVITLGISLFLYII